MAERRIHFKPKLDKIIELLLYMAHKRPTTDQYQAVKFLYLADKEHLNRYGRPITFETYYALPYGPVATHALDLIKNHSPTMKMAKIDELPFSTQKLDNIIFVKNPKRSVNYEIFSKSDLRIFDLILSEYGNKNFSDLYDITHEHFAYKNAWKGRKGSKRALMSYEDMLDEGPTKAARVDQLEDTSAHM